MKTIVKVPKSVKRMLATMEPKARSHYLKLFVKAIAEDASRSKRAPKVERTNDDNE